MRTLLSGPSAGEPADLALGYLAVDRPAPIDRPWVLANFVVSPDGSVAAGGRVGRLSSPADQEVFHLLRSAADVILVGAGTVRAEGYGPHRPTEQHRARRLAEGRPAAASMAVVSASLRLDLAASLFTGAEARTVVVAPRGADEALRAETATVADLILAGETTADLTGALRDMRQRGARLVVCEGGPLLLGELLTAGLVDELCLTVAPLLVTDPVRLLPAPLLTRPVELTLAHVLEDDGHLFLRYLVAGEGRR